CAAPRRGGAAGGLARLRQHRGAARHAAALGARGAGGGPAALRAVAAARRRRAADVHHAAGAAHRRRAPPARAREPRDPGPVARAGAGHRAAAARDRSGRGGARPRGATHPTVSEPSAPRVPWPLPRAPRALLSWVGATPASRAVLASAAVVVVAATGGARASRHRLVGWRLLATLLAPAAATIVACAGDPRNVGWFGLLVAVGW